MNKKNPPPRLILASQSPRRRYLLKQAGLDFAVIPSQVDEEAVALSDPHPYVTGLAEAKAHEVAKRHPESWVVGADTIVSIDGAILGKPRSPEQAREMLKRLSSQTHQVYTGFCLCCRARAESYSRSIATDVVFKELSEAEIDWYISTDEPFDKAGAYAIQGLGTFLVRAIHGSYTNVVGLPVCELIELLIQLGVVGLDSKNGLCYTGSWQS